MDQPFGGRDGIGVTGQVDVVPNGDAEATFFTKSSFAAADQAQLCYAKCAYGCTGSECHCDGFDPAVDVDVGVGPGLTTGALCLDAEGLRQACNRATAAGQACHGFVKDKHRNRGFLFAHTPIADGTSNAWVEVMYEHDSYDTYVVRKYRTTCNQFDKFLRDDRDFIAATPGQEGQINVGSLYVTQRADVGVDYVLEPNVASSVEVTGQTLDFSKDRIMVVDCSSTCGTSQATAYATVADDQAWSSLWALNFFVDRPSLTGVDDVEPATDPASPAAGTYREFPSQYCPGNNIDLGAPPAGASGSAQLLMQNHQCFKKCFTEAPCLDSATGGNCFCDGFLQGYDDAESDALCLDRSQCEDLCTLLGEECDGIDLHATLNRCFLNKGCKDFVEAATEVFRCPLLTTQEACEADPACTFDTTCQGKPTLQPDSAYHFLYASSDENSRRLSNNTVSALGRRMTAAGVRQLLAAADPGRSWEAILRYSGITFTSGGTFKLCFCDSAILEHGLVCQSDSDFTIEVGTIHASGLHCLLGDRRFTRGICETQMHGGLRCYQDGKAPVVNVPAAFLGVPELQVEAQPPTQVLSSFCLFGPEEEVASLEFCQGMA